MSDGSMMPEAFCLAAREKRSGTVIYADRIVRTAISLRKRSLTQHTTLLRHKLYLQRSFSVRGLRVGAFGQNRLFGSFAVMAKEQALKQAEG